MELQMFLHQLHFDTDKARPSGWEVDWEEAPLPYKLYRGLPVFTLTHEIPLSFNGQSEPIKPDLRKLSEFLYYAYGITGIAQTVFPAPGGPEPMQSLRRFAPSGGGLYPSELYIYLKIDGLPSGVYHYNAASHSLVLLREGNFDSYLARALGNRCDISSCFGTVFVSTMFWKNFFKYHHFSYRLQGLDAGALIGQLLEVSKRSGYAAGVYYQYLDMAVSHLLGLDVAEESVYALIPLSVEPVGWFCGREDDIVAEDLCRELPDLHTSHYVRSREVKPFPALERMNEASMMASAQVFGQVREERGRGGRYKAVPLPEAAPLDVDFAAACRNRFSPDLDFIMGKVTQAELSVLLKEASTAAFYRSDLDPPGTRMEPRLSLCVCVTNVDGIQDGVYSYDGVSHALEQVSSGDYRPYVQEGMKAGNVNLLQVPLCFHVAGRKDHNLGELGYRGYRIQQMEAGIMMQKLLLTASAIGMGSHPLLDYDAGSCDEMYQLPSLEKSALIQIPVGPVRPRAWLKGSLHS
jgi:SagB-type dehydrogenase family enzyme